MSQITEFESIGDSIQPVVTTNAYDGCYLDKGDFAKREKIGDDKWRMYDHEDSSVPHHGPLYQYADTAMVKRLAAFFGTELEKGEA